MGMVHRLRWLGLALALPLAGCETILSPPCDTSLAGNPATRFQNFPSDAGPLPEGSVYQTSPWDGPLLWFPGGMRYELDHNLGATPRWVSVWVSFSMSGTNGGIVARASANEAVILGVDSTSITVQNQGCQDFWLLVAASATGDPTSPH
jgi:hypothetical protein